jgi:hypothetical protein
MKWETQIENSLYRVRVEGGWLYLCVQFPTHIGDCMAFVPDVRHDHY